MMKIEHDARGDSDAEILQASLAISAKRQADALERIASFFEKTLADHNATPGTVKA